MLYTRRSASEIKQLFERASDESRQKIIAAKWHALKMFFNHLQQTNSFWGAMKVASNNPNSFILEPDNSPIDFPGLMIFKGDEEIGHQGMPLTGGFGHTKSGLPALVFHMKGKDFATNFPKYCGGWIPGIEDSFAHEYTHYLDSVQRGKHTAVSSKAATHQEYFNHPDEINAYWAEWRNFCWTWVRIIRDMDVEGRIKKQALDHHFGKTFQEFIEKMFRTHLGELDQANKKRVIKRAYQLWELLQQESSKIVGAALEAKVSEAEEPVGNPLDAENYDDFMWRLKNMTDPAERQKLLAWAEEENKRHRLYHGSPHKDISQNGFKLTKGRRSGLLGAEREVDNQGVFMTDSLPLAHHFGSNRAKNPGDYEIYKAYANLDSTLDLTKRVPKNLVKLGLGIMYPNEYTGPRPRGITQSDLWSLLDQPMFVQAIKDMGYTAVKFKETQANRKEAGDKGATTIMVLDPKNLSVSPHNDKIKTTDDLWKHLWGQKAHNQAPQLQSEALIILQEINRYEFDYGGANGLNPDDEVEESLTESAESSVGFRIQDSRYKLPDKSSSWWNTNDEDYMEGISCYAGFYDACADLLGGVAREWACYSDAIKSSGGTPCLSVLQGEIIGEEPEGYLFDSDGIQERRYTESAVLMAWNAVVGENNKSWSELDKEYELSTWQDDALASLVKGAVSEAVAILRLKESPQIYWRFQRSGAPPFSSDNARSMSWADMDAGYCCRCDGTGKDLYSGKECKPCEGTGEPEERDGYSCCYTLEDLRRYFSDSLNSQTPDDWGDIIAFEGKEVGKGIDGEPLVIPTKTLRIMKPSVAFRRRKNESTRSNEQGRFLFMRICLDLKKAFPEAAKIDFKVVPDNARANDGVRNFNARCVSEKGSQRIEIKESVLHNMPTSELVDLIRHELAHAYVRKKGLGKGHDQTWENIFRKFGGSGQRSPYCSD